MKARESRNDFSQYVDVACLIIAFLRCDGVERLMRAISLAGITRAYIAIDGCRNDSENEIQKELIYKAEELAGILGIELRIWKRDSNLGLAASVITGLNWFFSNEEYGIILEDDLDPHQDFFYFAKKSLTLYEDSKDIWLISGNQFYPKYETNNTAVCATYPLIWGWATWRKAWFEMESALLSEEKLSFNDAPRRVVNFLSVGKERSLNGTIESWAVPLAASVHAAKKFCLMPPVNLVGNLGVDSFAIHTRRIHHGGAHSTGALPINFEFLAGESFKDSRDVDSFIEKSVYKIRVRHFFLTLYRPILDSYLRKGNRYQSPLWLRVKSVRVP